MKLNLNQGWFLLEQPLGVTARDAQRVLSQAQGWMEVQLPCDVHMPLLALGRIPEPTEQAHCFASEWIEQRSWWFKRSLFLDAQALACPCLELCLDGLDCEADVFFNGAHLGRHRSVHRPFVQDLLPYARQGENLLLVRLTTGLERVSDQDLALVDKAPGPDQPQSRSDGRRVYLRKPQYVFGWDWTPRVATCGITGGASLCLHRVAAIRSLHPVARLQADRALLDVDLEAELFDPIAPLEAEISLRLLFEGRQVAAARSDALLLSGLSHHKLQLEVENPRLWFPNGYGEQPLYTLEAELRFADGSVRHSQRVGLRQLSVDLSKDSAGRRFCFTVNGVAIYARGGNWIPGDPIYARIPEEKLRLLLADAKAAGFNMLRVWGGGLFERDLFYDLCDELGILVWQDLMYACSLYPDQEPWFRREIELELLYQLPRLRAHACLGLICGNNEIQWIYRSWWKDHPQRRNLGGAYAFNHIAPRLMHALCPELLYWPSSPYGGDFADEYRFPVGNEHHWHQCTMHAEMERRITPEEYDKARSRFVTEYGYIGPCAYSSIERYYGGAPIRRYDEIWELHNNTFEKATVPEGIRKHYLDPEGLDLPSYLLYASMVQGLMLGYSLESFRFQTDCFGSLFWMYNDCWGEVGWSIVDYYLARKPAYYFVKRAFAPVKLLLRPVEGTAGRARLLGCNDGAQDLQLELELGYFAFDGSWRDTRPLTFTLPARQRTVLLDFDLSPCWDPVRGGVFALAPGLPLCQLRQLPVRAQALPEPSLSSLRYQDEDEDLLVFVTARSFCHGLHFDLPDRVRADDLYFDLLPGSSARLRFQGQAGARPAPRFVRPPQETSSCPPQG